MKSLIYNLLLVCGLIPTLAAANGKGGPSLTGATNYYGEALHLEIGSEHPYESEIKSFIKNSELPEDLKSEMLYDLDNTRIYYTNETISVDDLKRKLIMVLNKVMRKTTKTGDQMTQSIEEEYRVKEGESKLGINIQEVELKNDGTDKVWVAAFTTRVPREVYYFTPFSGRQSENTQDKNLKRKRLELVFHELAHRLSNYLETSRLLDNERFVSGFASKLTGLMLGEVSIKEVTLMLTKSGLTIQPSRTTPAFRNEIKLNGGVYNAQITVSVTGKDILWHGANGDHYEFQLNPAVFAKYPQIDPKGAKVVKFNSVPEGEEIRIIQNAFNDLQASQGSMPLELTIAFKKEVTQKEFETVRRTSYTNLEFMFESKEVEKALKNTVKSHGFIKDITVNPVFALMQSTRDNVRGIFYKLNDELNNLMVLKPILYNFLLNDKVYSNLKITLSPQLNESLGHQSRIEFIKKPVNIEGQSLPIESDVGVNFVYSLVMDNLESVTIQDIMNPFLGAQNSHYYYWFIQKYYSEVIQKTIFNDEIELKISIPTDETRLDSSEYTARAQLLYHFLLNNSGLAQKLKCVVSQFALKKLELKISQKVGTQELSWSLNLFRYSDFGLSISLPYEGVAARANALVSFVKNTILSSAIFPFWQVDTRTGDSRYSRMYTRARFGSGGYSLDDDSITGYDIHHANAEKYKDATSECR